MVHFTCDLCGKELTGSGDGRYVVKIEAYPGFDPTEIKEDDLDDDPMEAVAQILQRDEALLSEDLATPLQKGFRFDLCSVLSRQVREGPARERSDSLIRFQQELSAAQQPSSIAGGECTGFEFLDRPPEPRVYAAGETMCRHSRIHRSQHMFDSCQAH